MCTSAFTHAREVSTSYTHRSPSSSSPLSLSLSLSEWRSLKHMLRPVKPSSSTDLDYFRAHSTPDSFKRFPQMLPRSIAFLYFPLIFNSYQLLKFSISEICLFICDIFLLTLFISKPYTLTLIKRNLDIS